MRPGQHRSWPSIRGWYYDFQYRSERYTGCIGPVSKTIAKEILARKKAEAVEGRYELPSKKPQSTAGGFCQGVLCLLPSQ